MIFGSAPALARNAESARIAGWTWQRIGDRDASAVGNPVKRKMRPGAGTFPSTPSHLGSRPRPYFDQSVVSISSL